MNVDDLIKELEKYKGKKVYVSRGITFTEIKRIEEEEKESDMIYLITN